MKKIIVLFIIALSFSYIQSQTIPAEIDSNGYVYVNVTINDSETMKFMFDTGGGLMVLSNKVFQKIKDSMKPAGYFTGFRHDGDRIDAELYSLPSVTIGNYKITGVNTAVYTPLDEYGIDGIISCKEFENRAFTIDYQSKTFTIEDKSSIDGIERTAEVIPITVHDQFNKSLDIFVPLCLNDSIKLQAEFDTGSGHDLLLVNTYFLHKLGADTSVMSKGISSTPITKRALSFYVSKLQSLKYNCSANLENKDIRIIYKQDLIYEALIGSLMFKDKILTVDIPNKRLLVRK